ncbi:uncharacterized protein VTP21DRAFT_4075 [Calcarisporiella thermophila]
MAKLSQAENETVEEVTGCWNLLNVLNMIPQFSEELNWRARARMR